MIGKILNKRSKLSSGMLAFALLLSSFVFSALFDNTQAPTSEPIQTEQVLDGKKETKKHISYKKIVVAITGVQNFTNNHHQQHFLRMHLFNSTLHTTSNPRFKQVNTIVLEFNLPQKTIPSFSKDEAPAYIYS